MSFQIHPATHWRLRDGTFIPLSEMSTPGLYTRMSQTKNKIKATERQGKRANAALLGLLEGLRREIKRREFAQRTVELPA